MSPLSSIETDFFKKLADMGMEEAAKSLSKIVNLNVDISIPLMTFKQIENLIALKNQNISALTMGISGKVSGLLIIVFSEKSSFWLIDKMSQKPIGTTKGYDEMGKSAMREFCNIIGGSFLTSLSNFLSLRLLPKLPKLFVGKGYELKEEIKESVSGEVKGVLSVKTELDINKKKIDGEIYLILDEVSFKNMFSEVSKKAK